jgi:hypothetical protein
MVVQVVVVQVVVVQVVVQVPLLVLRPLNLHLPLVPPNLKSGKANARSS